MAKTYIVQCAACGADVTYSRKPAVDMRASCLADPVCLREVTRQHNEAVAAHRAAADRAAPRGRPEPPATPGPAALRRLRATRPVPRDPDRRHRPSSGTMSRGRGASTSPLVEQSAADRSRGSEGRAVTGAILSLPSAHLRPPSSQPRPPEWKVNIP
jgi:hypothetical protein